MTKLPWFKFYAYDWLSDSGLRRCSPSCKGIWIDILCLMFDCDERGYLISDGTPWTDEEIASALPYAKPLVFESLNQLLDRGVAVRNKRGVLFSPSMVHDAKVSGVRRKARRWTKKKTLTKREENSDKKGTKLEQKSHIPSSSSSSSHSEISPLGEQKNSVEKDPPSFTGKIYEAYPRHIGKAKAFPAIEKAIEVIARRGGWMKKEAATWLLYRVQKFAESPAGKRGTFTPHPTTWMNGGRYDDDEAEWQRTDGESDSPARIRGTDTSDCVLNIHRPTT